MTWTHHVLLIHSSVAGYLGCFHFSPVMYNAAVIIIRVQVPAGMFVFLSLERVKHTYWLPCDSASNLPGNGQAVFHFTFPAAKCEGSALSTPSPTLVRANLFDSSPRRGCEVHRHCGVICISWMLRCRASLRGLTVLHSVLLCLVPRCDSRFLN